MLFRRNENLLAGFLLGCLFCGASQTPAQVLVEIGQNFTGSTFGLNSSALPPDSNGAIGPRHFMEFINGAVAVYNRTNVLNVQRKSDIKFWSDAGLIISPDSAVTDPRVIYDPTVQRWFASQVDASTSAGDPTLEGNDFLFAVSDTSDPTRHWHGFSFQADPDTFYFADFPTLGVDSNAVYISGDFYQGMDNPIGPGLVSIPKSDLLLSTPTIDNRTWFGVMDYAERGQVLQPAICLDGSSSGSMLAAGDIGMDTDPHSNLIAFAVQNAAGPGAATLTASTSISVLPYEVPYNSILDAPFFSVTQPDGTTTLVGNDARLSAKVYAVGGVLYAVHSTDLNNRIVIRWYRISAAHHTVLELGTIADANLDLFFPSIAANSDGTVVISCNGSSIDTYVSCYALVGQTVSGVTTFGDPILLQSGLGNYHDLSDVLGDLLGEPAISRWGDYSAMSVDPADASRFWAIQMYPSGEDDLGAGIWSTQITELVTVNPALSIARSNGNAVVSWQVSSIPFKLESTTQLAPAHPWSVINLPFTTNNSRIYFQTPLTNTARFFRLHKP